MKKKYLVPAAAAAAALVLLAAALLWYGRSRSFRAVFPLSGSVEVSCRAQWTPEEGQGYARDLTRGTDQPGAGSPEGAAAPPPVWGPSALGRGGAGDLLHGGEPAAHLPGPERGVL